MPTCEHGFEVSVVSPCSVENHERSAFRQDLAKQYGDTWSTDEMAALFEVVGFGMGLCVVRRRSDGALGSLEFTHRPRFYYNFIPHEGV